MDTTFSLTSRNNFVIIFIEFIIFTKEGYVGKVVINRCYGGFGLSHEAMMQYLDQKGIVVYPEKHSSFYMYWLTPPSGDKSDNRRDAISDNNIDRDDPILVQIVETLGKKSWGHCAELDIIDIDAGTPYRIEEYDGLERLITQSTYDWKVAK
jgi:hypothetical protein